MANRTPFSSPLEHLALHLSRLSLLIAAHVARLPPSSRRLRGEMAEEALVARLARFGDQDVPETTRKLWGEAADLLVEIEAREALSQIDLPLCRLVRRFSLSATERDVLLLAAASRIDPRFAEHWSSADMRLDSPSIQAVIAILGRSFAEGVAMRRLFALNAPLLAHSLLLAESWGTTESAFLSLDLEVPRRVLGELLGESHVSEELVAFSALHAPSVSMEQVVLPAHTKELVLSLVQNHGRFLELRRQWGIDDVVSYGKGVVLLFAGPPGTGKTMLAHAVAHSLGRRLFCLDIARLLDGQKTLESNLDAAFREARLLDAVLFFDECEQLFRKRTIGNDALAMLLTRLERFDGVALLATNQAHMLDEALSRRILAQIDFSPPTTSARTEIWRKHLPPALPMASDVDVAQLAESFELSGGLIKNAVLAAVVRAVSRASEQIEQADLLHGARLQLRTVGDTEQRLEPAEVRLADVRLPAEVTARLEALVRAARARSTVLSEWGMGRTLGRGTGLAALFSGPPGTGKSMAAEAVAAELARPLLRAHLPSLVSSYAGETGRNLEKLFERAREHRAVLVFDEADALFGPRVAVRTSTDRLSNGEVGALLSLLERHEGLVLLTSNLPEAIDPAFSRRLHMQVAFPLPDASLRAALWRQFLRSDAPVARDVDPVRLGRQYELSGGAIRAAVMLAALEAASAPAASRSLTQAMLERAAAEQAGGAPVVLRGVGVA